MPVLVPHRHLSGQHRLHALACHVMPQWVGAGGIIAWVAVGPMLQFSNEWQVRVSTQLMPLQE